jgi:DNA-binding NarL/FixJ family response regulator
VIRALVVADSGAVMAALTEALWAMPGVDIVGHASGRTSVGAIAASMRPDVVLVDEMRWPVLGLARIRELRAAVPGAAVVGLCDSADGDWIRAGLDAGASAVVPRALDATTLTTVLGEVSPHRRATLESRAA